MQLQYTIEKGEYIEAGRLWAKHKARRRYDSYMTSWRGIVLLLLILLSGLLIAQAKGAAAAWIWISLGSIYAFSIVICALMRPRMLRKGYEKQKASMTVRLLIEEDRVESEREDGATLDGIHGMRLLGSSRVRGPLSSIPTLGSSSPSPNVR